MAKSDTVFSGSIPELYDLHLAPLLFGPYAADVACRFTDLATGRLLETAAGTGIVTRALAAALPDAVEIVATDLNQSMLDHASAMPAMGRVRFQQADALALPFADRSFDAVVCQFGVMFFPDRAAGLREARRVLKPGGRLVFNVWDRLARSPAMAVVVEALARLYPAHPSWFLDRVPCGYHDPDKIRSDLVSAGFTRFSIETTRLTGQAAAARDAAIGLCQGTPTRAEIETLDPSGLGRATTAAEAAVRAHFGPGSFTAPMQALTIEAMA